MMILGITGGVGSGKSTVLNYLKCRCNARVIEADITARKLMEPGEDVYKQIRGAFPGAAPEDGDPIDREYLSGVIFNDKEKRERLNAIVHPAVRVKIEETAALWKKNARPGDILVIEAAILIETGYRDLCDAIWYVFCDREERIKRLYKSRGYSREKSLSVMESQLGDEQFRLLSDAVIDNSRSMEYTVSQIDSLLPAES